MDYNRLSPKLRKEIVNLETPYYLFDTSLIKRKILKIKELINPLQIFYALKANSLPEIIKTVSESGCGFEINNLAEYERIVSVIKKKDIPFINSSPISSPNDVYQMYHKGIKYFTWCLLKISIDFEPKKPRSQ